jgi:hypothetical protein
MDLYRQHHQQTENSFVDFRRVLENLELNLNLFL